MRRTRSAFDEPAPARSRTQAARDLRREQHEKQLQRRAEYLAEVGRKEPRKTAPRANG